MQAVPSCHIGVFGSIKSIRTLSVLPLLLILAFVMTSIRPQLEPFLFSFYWVNTDLLLLSVLFFPLILAHLTVFLSFPVCQLPSIVTRVCAGGVSTVLCGAAVLNHTGFLSCMNRYLLSLEPYQWTAIFSSFCVLLWFTLIAADCLCLNAHLITYRDD